MVVGLVIGDAGEEEEVVLVEGGEEREAGEMDEEEEEEMQLIYGPVWLIEVNNMFSGAKVGFILVWVYTTIVRVVASDTLRYLKKIELL